MGQQILANPPSKDLLKQPSKQELPAECCSLPVSRDARETGPTWGRGGSCHGSLHLLHGSLQLSLREGEGVELAQQLLGIAVAQAEKGRHPSPPLCLRPLLSNQASSDSCCQQGRDLECAQHHPLIQCHTNQHACADLPRRASTRRPPSPYHAMNIPSQLKTRFANALVILQTRVYQVPVKPGSDSYGCQ